MSVLSSLNWKIIGMIAAIIGIIIVAYLIYSSIKKQRLKEETEKLLAQSKIEEIKVKQEQIKNLPQIKQKILDDIASWEKRKADWFAKAPGTSGVRQGLVSTSQKYPPPSGYDGPEITKGDVVGTYIWDKESLDNVRAWFDSKISSLRQDLANLGKI